MPAAVWRAGSSREMNSDRRSSQWDWSTCCRWRHCIHTIHMITTICLLASIQSIRFDGVAGYHTCLTHMRSPDRSRVGSQSSISFCKKCSQIHNLAIILSISVCSICKSVILWCTAAADSIFVRKIDLSRHTLSFWLAKSFHSWQTGLQFLTQYKPCEQG